MTKCTSEFRVSDIIHHHHSIFSNAFVSWLIKFSCYFNAIPWLNHINLRFVRYASITKPIYTRCQCHTHRYDDDICVSCVSGSVCLCSCVFDLINYCKTWCDTLKPHRHNWNPTGVHSHNLNIYNESFRDKIWLELELIDAKVLLQLVFHFALSKTSKCLTKFEIPIFCIHKTKMSRG